MSQKGKKRDKKSKRQKEDRGRRRKILRTATRKNDKES